MLALHFWWQVLLVVIISTGLSCGVWFVTFDKTPSYTSTMTLVTNISGTSLSGIASVEAQKIAPDYPGYKIGAVSSDGTENVSIQVVGPDEETVKEISGLIAEKVFAQAEGLYSEAGSMLDSDSVPRNISTGFKGYIGDTDVKMKSVDVLRSLIVAGVVGLLVGIIVVVVALIVYDMRRRPVIDGQEISGAFGIPALASEASSDLGLCVLEYIHFLNQEGVKDLAIISAGIPESAKEVDRMLRDAVPASNQADRYKDLCVHVLSKDDCEIQRNWLVIISAWQWRDSLFQVEETLERLRLKSINVTGFILCH